MLKVGIIGLGDIAQKAYLPVFCNKEVEFHLYTRDTAKLYRVGRAYRFANLHLSIESILSSGIQAAFVHTSTSSHVEIIHMLLMNNIHVYVDKPITYDYKSSEKLASLALSRNLILMVGFNRRYAPMYKELRQLKDINMIIMQKNRHSLPEHIRNFIFDDFIHVVDTLRYLFPYPVSELIVRGMKQENVLSHVIIQLRAENGAIAVGIMNRDSGVVEEKVEVFSPTEKRTVQNLSTLRVAQNRSEICRAGGDWDPTLFKRGFDQITSDFLEAVRSGGQPEILLQDALLTHEMCEDIVVRLSGE